VNKHLSALLAGVVFGVGLALSGMTQSSKVIGFLDVTGDWDPSLAFVMMGAVAVHFVLLRLVLRRKAPLLEDRFRLPTRRDVDAKLLAGAALFGVGWGLAGYCPGPALVASATGRAGTVAFVLAMAVGMKLLDLGKRPDPEAEAPTFVKQPETL
jgi:uncharacterized membrane protein YedE/YeeE